MWSCDQLIPFVIFFFLVRFWFQIYFEIKSNDSFTVWKERDIQKRYTSKPKDHYQQMIWNDIGGKFTGFAAFEVQQLVFLEADDGFVELMGRFLKEIIHLENTKYLPEYCPLVGVWCLLEDPRKLLGTLCRENVPGESPCDFIYDVSWSGSSCST